MQSANKELTLLLTASLANAERSPSLLSYSFLLVSLMMFKEIQDRVRCMYKHLLSCNSCVETSCTDNPRDTLDVV